MNSGNYKKIGEVCDFIGGSQPPKSNFVYELDGLDRNKYVRLIQIRDYKSNRHIVYVPRSMAKKFCSIDDVMIGRYGPPLFQTLRGLEGAYNVALMKAVPKREEQLDRDYLFLFLQSPDIQGYVINLSSRAAGQTGVNKPALYNYPILLPPIQEQKRIVAILDQAFSNIEKIRANTEKNLKNARELFESYLQQVFSQGGEGWCRSNLGDVCNVIGGGTPSKSKSKFYDGEIPWATVRDMKKNHLTTTEFKISKEAVSCSSTNVIESGNIIIATRVGLGKVCLLNQDTAINQDLKAVIPKNKNLDKLFLFWWFKHMSNIIEAAGIGATVKGVKLPFIKNLQISFPSVLEQNILVNKISEIKQQTDTVEKTYYKKLDALDHLKKSLLHQAFTGQLTKQEAVA